MAKKGLYANIHAKRKRIKAGSKEKMRKKGAKGAPTASNSLGEQQRLLKKIMAKTAAWQRKEGKNPKGGLNAKGRASYKRQTGGTLKAPSKKVGNKRRASFCARMKGMKRKLTSAKTARDPNSRINK